MNKIFNKWVLAAALICSCLTYLSAQPTREQLAQIRVDKEGNFKYWNGDAAALAQLKAFVAAVTTEGSEQYVPVRDRLAVFDMDGTLLCETAPFYMNWLVMLHRLLDDQGYTPTDELRSFGEAAKAGMYDPKLIDREMDDRAQYVQAEIFKGLTTEEMDEWMRSFLEKPCEGLEGLTWGTALYWPMVEVVSYLVANDFQVYVCSGTAQDMLRPLIDGVLPIGRYQVMGSEIHYVPEGEAEAFGWQTPVIMETYGAGNAPTGDWFLDIVREAGGMGKILVNVTQCLTGSVDMDLYANGKAMARAGVVNGYDGTTESTLAKLFFLMGKSSDNEWVKEMLTKNLKGEITK
jgi:hypothetical protein